MSTSGIGLADLPALRAHLLEGHVIPAMPLALDPGRRWSERHQRALARYYCDAGAGGVAVGVHSTQFEIREARHGLFEPVLELVSREVAGRARAAGRAIVRIAGVCGPTAQATREAAFARGAGYDAALLSLAAFRDAGDEEMLAHCRAVGEILPVIGFYLQPAVGGRLLGAGFWRRFAEIESVVAIKIAPFDRYQTWDVIRAVIEAGRDDLALYTGNDDSIIVDLITPWEYGGRRRWMAGGLLGQFGVWTRRAVEMLEEIKACRGADRIDVGWLTRNAELTDANAALFDAANGFAGCLPGIHEVLRRQGLLPSILCLDPGTILSPGQTEEIDRVIAAYPDLRDDGFVAGRLDGWLAE